MIKTVVREHHWTPNYVDDLYIDEVDYFGLGFWYNDVKECHDEIKKK